jgi:Putative Ig domain./Fibronectin type III domain.
VRPQQSYSFQPVATDPDGDALTFTAENLPGWLTLNPRTGRLSGTPTEADIGTYHRIVVSVSDGRASTSLPPFSITVTDAAVGSATLSWMPPDRNTDGSVLTDLAGYEIWYGQDRDALDQRISLMNPSLSLYVVENLSSGTWYFAVAAVNSRGIAGGLSEVVSKTIS